MFVRSELEVRITSQSFVTLHLLVSEIANVLPEPVYCCFTRTIFNVYCYDCGVFIDVYTKFRLDWLLRERVTWPSMPPYRNVMPEAVLQELHCFPNCLHVCMIRVRGCSHFTKFHCFTPSGV